MSELDKQVALAMGWRERPLSIDRMKLFYGKNWETTAPLKLWKDDSGSWCLFGLPKFSTSYEDWSIVERWMVANFTDAQKLRFCREYAFLIMEANGKPLGKLYDLFEAVTAPLPVRCKAFLAVVETAVSEEEE